VQVSAEFPDKRGRLKTQPGHLRSLAATARLANVPSVVSNVMLGVILVTTDFASGVLVAAVCLYLCGGFLNDWADRKWDAERRPERALPSGLFTPAGYLGAGLGMAACALAAAALTDWRALVVAASIALCIGLYTWLHKQSAWSAVFMGLCRALLPLLGWAAAADPALLPAVLLAGLALFFHVAGISLLARGESLPQAARGAGPARGCFAAAALVMWLCGLWIFAIPPMVSLIGLLPYALWTGRCLIRRDGTAGRVAGLLAGIPLVDWMLLLPLYLLIETGQPHDWVTGICLGLPPLAFLAGRALQRITPAT
jgi:4-hydroxybenzoate polyprenyltransferase